MNRFYITTPIYYVNDRPHVGTAYSTVLADILHRYHQFFGGQSFFLTGVDEHGQKCEQAARKKNMDPQTHCDQMSAQFKKTWDQLDISYNDFYRTTSKSHHQKVKQALQKLQDKGHIYESTYEGWYCVSEEIFYTEKDLVNGLSPLGKKVIKIKEKNYFFKMSQFRNRLIQHLKDHPHFIYPKERQNEVLGFLHQGLSDLCISRPKSRLKWGIECPFDKDYVAYVWVDALLNYVFGIGLWQEDSKNNFNDWWPGAVHLLGKDILITHAVYWPCILMALDIVLPKQMISHGWLLNKDQEKMSKSQGEVMDPLELMNQIGSDSLRYFFIKAVKLGQDAPISNSMIIKEHNQDLANNLGNTLQRITRLIESHFDKKIPEKSPLSDQQKMIQEKMKLTCHNVQKYILSFSTSEAMGEIVSLLNMTNKYLEDEAPWKLQSLDQMGSVLRISLESLRTATSLLQPVIPKMSLEILKRIGLGPQTFKEAQTPFLLKDHQVIEKGPPIFPRIK